jgi:nicotinamide mononucleotide (NMN) deamidase PncC
MITGGGTQMISRLLEEPGGSNTVLQALIPYSEAAMEQHLGFKPARACSEETARWMAMHAYQLASAENSEQADTTFGIAITAGLASQKPKRGEHRIHIAAQTRSTTFTWSLVLKKGHRSRADEELLCRDMALNALCEILQLQAFTTFNLHQSETILSHCEEVSENLQQLLFSKNSATQLTHLSRVDRPELVFPGAFDPLHDGHIRMLELASKITGLKGCYELCVHNIEKPRLDFISLAQRCAPFKDNSHNLILTTATRFTDKASCFPSAIFVAGIDTLERIADPQYYDNSSSKRDAAITKISELACRFLVFGRVQSGTFKHLENVDIPASLKAISSAVPESVYRMDLSSSDLRTEREKNSPG